MRCITLWQPWASLVGIKKHETRSWQTNYRGELAIHSAKRKADIDIVCELQDHFEEVKKLIWHFSTADNYTKVETDLLPLGCVVTIANLVNCLEMWNSQVYGPLMPPHRRGIDISTIDALEKALGDWQEGRFAWELDKIFRLPEPIPAQGKQGLWTPSSELLTQLTRNQ